MLKKGHLRFLSVALYIVLGALILWILFKYVLGLAAPFLIAFAVSRIITPPVNCVRLRFRIPGPLASGIFTILFYGGLIFILYLLISRLIGEAASLLESLRMLNLDSLSDSITRTFNAFLNTLPHDIATFVRNNISSWLAELGGAISDVLSPLAAFAANTAAKLPSLLVTVTVTVVSTYFFTSDYELISKKLLSIIPKKAKLHIAKMKPHAKNAFVCYVKAFFLLLLLTFVELSVGLTLLRVRHPILLSLLITVVDALPVLGTGCVLLPWAVVSIMSKNVPLAIGLILLYITIVAVRNALEPKIIGKQIGLHPLVTLASIYAGLRIFGIAGMLMPIPVALGTHFFKSGYFDFQKSPDGEPET